MLYLLKIDDDRDESLAEWDAYLGFVIKAKSEKAARKFAAAEDQKSRQKIWLNPEYSRCFVLAELPNREWKDGIILGSFNSG